MDLSLCRDEIDLRDRHIQVLEGDIAMLQSHIEHLLLYQSSTNKVKSTPAVSDDITSDILAALSGKALDKLQILKSMKDLRPTITTSDVNSKLYALKNKGKVCQIPGKTTRPLWTLC